jgi:hypothetical protein
MDKYHVTVFYQIRLFIYSIHWVSNRYMCNKSLFILCVAKSFEFKVTILITSLLRTIWMKSTTKLKLWRKYRVIGRDHELDMTFCMSTFEKDDEFLNILSTKCHLYPGSHFYLLVKNTYTKCNKEDTVKPVSRGHL